MVMHIAEKYARCVPRRASIGKMEKCRQYSRPGTESALVRKCDMTCCDRE